MSRERIEGLVAVQHNEDPFTREPSKVRGNLESLCHRLGESGVFSVVEFGVIELKAHALEFTDRSTAWLRVPSESGDLIVDPHHPVLSHDTRIMMVDLAFGDNYSDFKAKIPELLPDGEIFPLGRSDAELRHDFRIEYYPTN